MKIIEKLGDYIFPVLFFGAIFFATFIQNVCDPKIVIKEIGGCNQYECGVTYSDGTYGKIGEPVIGLSKCTYELRLPWNHK